MDVTGWLLRRAVPSAFVVTGVGGTGARLAVERVLRERGWGQALAPAEADLLIVCGPRPDAGRDSVDPADRVWDQLPGPRARVRVDGPDVAARLDGARAELRDVARQRRDAEQRDRAAAGSVAADGDDAMAMPGGVPMADRGEDRDGLTLDQLHLALGPALPDWPAGLSVTLTIQGDVVQDAAISIVGAPADATTAYWDAPVAADGRIEPLRSGAARALDSMQRLLSVAGWPAAAISGRRLRDAVLGTGTQGLPARDLVRWLHTVRRSRMLRWSTNGLGEITSGAPTWLHGDATSRWLRWLDDVESAATNGDGATPPDPRATTASRAQGARAALGLLPSLVAGQELAAVRLIVASLDPDLETLVAVDREDSHG